MPMPSVPLQTIFLASAFLALAGPGNPALAQPSEAETAAIRQNCRSDFMARCMSVKPGGIEAFQCLKKNEASLSAACRSAVNAVAATEKPAAAKPAAPAHPTTAQPTPTQAAPVQAAPATTAAPAATPKQAAPSNPAAKPAAAKSARPKPAAPKPVTSRPSVTATPAPANAATPSQSATPAPRLRPLQEARLVREFCTTDYQVLCKGVRLGQGRALKCLSDNQPSLSPGCKQAMGLTGR